MEWKVAPAYSNWTITSVDEEKRKAVITITCDKCGGSGIYAHFGVCFKCNGSGKNVKIVKAYTESEYDKYIAAQDRARERKAERKEAERLKLEQDSEANKAAKLKEFGYDPEDAKVYLVVGEDSYSIKDELKENGFHFCRELGWYATKEAPVPTGYSLTAVAFDKVFGWDYLKQRFFEKDEAKEVADAARASVATPSASEYIGEIKERIRNLEVKYVKSREVESYYGISTLYTFKAGENVLIWFSSGKGLPQDVQPGDSILLTGTVKDHKERNGVKQTVLTRCTVK